ncbi:neuronal acetylcholine receptor subunit alpha-7-like [Paramuricea clavata]|uniref:Neuronal acetylcholine receptor subunit alpha-7-like n=1 Tax=Paramuricea clavata TaxID=317549 RepID=A0A7D9I6N4_PARCT|nr:neuronal acetylcholine receptor subunit alpha-7-like [Paramuricea clavata]
MGRAIGLNEPVVVSSDGRVRWLTPTILDGFCKQFVRYFPFDEQYCPLKFYSWNYDVKKLMLSGNDRNMLSNYTESGTWAIMDIIKKEHTTKKDNIAKATVTFVVRIQRKVFYYFVYLIAPCVLTAILATLIFYLPAASGERMVVGCTILLALSVFFLLATNYIPETSEHVPLVGRYYSMVIVEICIALVCTAWVLRYHYRNPAMGKIPRWIRVYIFGYISKLVRIKVPEEMLAKNTPVDEEVQGPRSKCLTGSLPKKCGGLLGPISLTMHQCLLIERIEDISKKSGRKSYHKANDSENFGERQLWIDF